MKKRIPVSQLKEYYKSTGNNPDDLMFVKHAYKDDEGRYFAYIPLSPNCNTDFVVKGLVYRKWYNPMRYLKGKLNSKR